MSSVQRALISVSDKSGIVDFCRELEQLGVAMLSTGGTFRLLRSNNIQVTDVSEYTGFPEIMDGRVKTLHPKIHGGLLGRPGRDDGIMEELDIPPIDLVVVNLYPFEATVKRAGCTLAEAVQNIDIGGPTMLRAAAKNYEFTGVIVDAADYPSVLKELRDNGNRLSVETCFRLAQKVFSHTANYDANVANYLGASDHEGNSRNYPHTYTMQFGLAEELRYGENPHQCAAFYTEPEPAAGTLAAARQLQGKALSYNNLADADAALECVSGFDDPACVIVKHANPCGVAVAGSLRDAYTAAYATDPVSAFGGIIAFNRSLDRETAQDIIGAAVRGGNPGAGPGRRSPLRNGNEAGSTGAGYREPGFRAGAAGTQTRQRRVAGSGLRYRNSQAGPVACSDPAQTCCRGAGRHAVCLAGGEVRQVQRHRLCRRTPDDRYWRRPDEPGLQRQNRRDQGRRCRPGGRRRGHGVGCLLSFPRRHRFRCAVRHQGRHSAGRLGAGQRGHRGGG